jgi:hypothetical protein
MIDYLLTIGYGAQTSTLFMTSESARSVLWDPALNRHQDYDFVIRYKERYRFAVKSRPTVIYTYNGAAPSAIDFASCIRVIARNAGDISPLPHHRYHTRMLALARRLDAPAAIVEHYEKEAARHLF